MASFLYTSFLRDMANGDVVCDTDTFKMMLCTSSYTPNKDHAKRSDITNETSGTGYTAGGAACTVTVTLNTASDRIEISISEPTWPTASFSAAYGVVYKTRGGASSADELVALLDFGGTITATGGTFATNETTPFYVNN